MVEHILPYEARIIVYSGARTASMALMCNPLYTLDQTAVYVAQRKHSHTLPAGRLDPIERYICLQVLDRLLTFVASARTVPAAVSKSSGSRGGTIPPKGCSCCCLSSLRLASSAARCCRATSTDVPGVGV